MKVCRIVEESVKARDWITLLLFKEYSYLKKRFEYKNRIISNTFNRISQRLIVIKLNQLSWQLCLNFFATNCSINYSTSVEKIIENLTKFVFAIQFYIAYNEVFFLYLLKKYNVCIIKSFEIYKQYCNSYNTIVCYFYTILQKTQFLNVLKYPMRWFI